MIKIEITFNGRSDDLNLIDYELAAFGLKRTTRFSHTHDGKIAEDGPANPTQAVPSSPETGSDFSAEDKRRILRADPAELASELGAATASEVIAAANAQREPGKPAPGRARRTKAEIAEDEARGAVSDEQPAISTGEERISPEDAADEAAEAAATKSDTPTTEDLRRALAQVVDKVGAIEAMDKVKELLGGKSPAEVPADEIPGALQRIETFLTGSETVEAPAAKTLDEYKAEIKAAMFDYAEKFDKTRDPAKAKFALQDIPAVFKLVWPDAADPKLSTLPYEPENLDRALAGIREAIAKNPWKR